ncbi:unnamed protein product [Ostreobium quekettii]|uniref:Uncharacterized protein n=1 Tax=Ostreobium quekettii TaxID=121088 RepID=A0A8S1J765_9CHLO|nr:unnamed protein product [Ostreobium quekettii]
MQSLGSGPPSLSFSQGLGPEDMTVSTVPSAEEVWSRAWGGIEPVGDGRGTSISSPSSGTLPAKAHQLPLNLQALRPPARLRLMATALSEVHKRVLAMPEAARQCSPKEWRSTVARLFVSCCLATASHWRGDTPAGLAANAPALVDRLASSNSQQTQGNPKKGNKDKANSAPAGEEGNAWLSLFDIVGERMPLYSAVVRYLRFQPQKTSQLELRGLQNDAAQAHTAAPIPTGQLNADFASEARVHHNGEENNSVGSLLFAKSGGSLKGDPETGASEVGTGVQGTRYDSNGSTLLDTSPSLAVSSQSPKGLADGGVVTPMSNKLALDNSMMPASAEVPQVSGFGASGCVLGSSPFIVQDFAVCVAEVVATDYLASVRDAAVDGDADDALTGSDWPACLQPSLQNTRSLERFRNRVLLSRFMYRQFISVVAIFEDYHLLWGFHKGGRLLQRRVQARRKKELSMLAGMRLAVSIALEGLDAITPLATTFLNKLGDLVSFLLVSLLGRALGLIAKGIKSSLRGESAKRTDEGNKRLWV